MAIDVSQLTTVVQRAREIMGRTIMHPNSIFDIATPHTGYNKGPISYRFYTAGGDLGTCCTTPTGTGEFDEVEFRAECIKKENRFCGEDLQEKLNDFEFRVTAGQESIDRILVDLFTEEELAWFANALERLAVLGDTTSADPNLNILNGYVTQALANGTTVTLTATSLNQAIIELVRALPTEAQVWGEIGVFMPPEWANLLQLYLVNQNLYHYPVGERGLYDRFALPGIANVQIIPLYGLTGTNYMWATPIRNMHWFTNLTNDKMTLLWQRCECDDDWLMRIKMILGVTFLIYDYVVIAQVDDSIVNTPWCFPVCSDTPTAGGASIFIPTSASVDVKDLTPEQIAEALAAKGVNVPAALTKMI